MKIHMKINLKSIFAITAFFALISAWLTMQSSVVVTGPFVQLVAESPKGPESIKASISDFQDRFYTLLSSRISSDEKLKLNLPLDRQEEYIREHVRLNVDKTDFKTCLISIHGMGSRLIYNGAEIRSLLRIAIETVEDLDGDSSLPYAIELLYVPKL